jgi:hypothetical protein
MDTVEWGSVDPATIKRKLPPLDSRMLRRGGLALAVLGFLTLVASTALPWASMQSSRALDNLAGTDNPNPAVARTVSMGLDSLGSTSALAYEIGLIALLGLTGMVLAARPAQRRTLVGAALGAAGGEALLLIELVQSIRHAGTSGSQLELLLNSSGSVNATIAPGAYLAFAGLGLTVAAIITAAGIRARPSAPAAAAQAPPDLPDQPADLTVTPLVPVDERYFARPEER